MITGIIEATENSLMPITNTKVLMDNVLVSMSLAGASHIFVLCPPYRASEFAGRFDHALYEEMGIYPKILSKQKYTKEVMESLRGDFTFFAQGNKWISPMTFSDGMNLTSDSRDSTVYIGTKTKGALWYTYLFPKNAKFTLTPEVYQTYDISFAVSVTNIAAFIRLIEQEKNK